MAIGVTCLVGLVLLSPILFVFIYLYYLVTEIHHLFTTAIAIDWLHTMLPHIEGTEG